jgi:hypothetical protein
LNVTIGGTAAGKRPSCFALYTDQGFPHTLATLQFPGDAEIGKTGDPVTVSLLLADETHTLFTGEIYTALSFGRYRDLFLTDGFKKLCATSIIAAYRKEKASVILQDTLDKAGIDKTAVTCPAVEIARFSTENISASWCIVQLIKALEEHGYKGLRFFFDAKNTFRFGTADDTGKNEGTVYEFETRKNIVKKGDRWIDVFPLPIRHSQEVTVDGARLIVDRTDMDISGIRSNLRLWLKEAE